jgi:DNA repair exonuclease SbcCD ATPase subunit
VTLDEAIDHLYAADLDAFVAERARIARELREAGDGSASEHVAKLKKPTVAAWALNRLARERRRDVDLLLDAGHRLRQAQEGVVGGADRESFEKAQTTERDALRRLTQQASQLLGGASPQVLSQISGTLRAAAVSEEGRELLARGRFTTPLEAEGFDVFGALPASRPARTKKQDRAKQANDELKKARERLRELEQKAKAAERDAERLKGEWKKSERAAESARVAVAAAQRELTQAQRRARK